MAYEFSRNFELLFPGGSLDSGALTGLLLDSNFVFETSGDAIMCAFSSPVTQSSSTLTVYAYCTATPTGSPDVNVEIRNGPASADDSDRPEAGGSTIGTPGSAVSPTAEGWVTFSNITALSLTRNNIYFVIIKNTHGTPASNNLTIAYRGDLDGCSLLTSTSPGTELMRGGSTTNGFTTDPTVGAGLAPIILKFGDGTTLMGNPYVRSMAISSNTDWRGNRITFDNDVVVSGMARVGGSTALQTADFRIYQGATQIVAETGNRFIAQENFVTRFAATQLTKDLAYDFVYNTTAVSTVGSAYDMGAGTIPDDVKNCRFAGVSHVTGADRKSVV